MNTLYYRMLYLEMHTHSSGNELLWWEIKTYNQKKKQKIAVKRQKLLPFPAGEGRCVLLSWSETEIYRQHLLQWDPGWDKWKTTHINSRPRGGKKIFAPQCQAATIGVWGVIFNCYSGQKKTFTWGLRNQVSHFRKILFFLKKKVGDKQTNKQKYH